MTDRFFLCFGLPKSGTTFLQRVLGMHPEVSCPSEQRFGAIVRTIDRFKSEYNKALKDIDRRTGGQGAPAVNDTVSNAILRDTILNLSRGFAAGKPVHGLNDNSVFFNLEFFDNLFEHPPMICIFRNPVDQAISTWQHNRRLAEEERDLADVHLKFLDNPEGTFEGYIKLRVREFRKIVEQYCAFSEGRSNVLTVRYESLVRDKGLELQRLFSFLGVDTSPALLETVERESTPERMAELSAYPGFFGQGVTRPDPGAQFRAGALASCAGQLARLGYPPDFAETHAP